MAGRLWVRDVLDRVDELCDLLDRTAAAMSAVDADALRAIEQPLAQALEELRAAMGATTADTKADTKVHTIGVTRSILRAKAALRQCERLGFSFAAVSGLALHGSGAYGRDGGYVRAASRPALDVVT